MPLIFHTPRSSAYDVEIAGVGVVAADARGGIPVERAAERLHELQDKNGEPLKGAPLESAARAFADARGLAIKALKNIDEEKLRVEAGAFPSGPTIEEISRRASERDFGQAQAHMENPAAGVLTADDLPPQETAVHPELPEEARA